MTQHRVVYTHSLVLTMVDRATVLPKTIDSYQLNQYSHALQARQTLFA